MALRYRAAARGPRGGDVDIIYRMDTHRFRAHHCRRWPRCAFFPHFQLRCTYGIESPASVAVFFVRHWGVLIFVVGLSDHLLRLRPRDLNGFTAAAVEALRSVSVVR